MPKKILIFSDGTGQIGGQKPDQRLSNVYKMYRAMRPGPSSPIKPSEQVAFYDPGLGAGEVGGITFKRIRNILEGSVGTGIDGNIIDCYSAIISYYEPGDEICLFGFSRGAYTVRSLANVMNLCGVPTKTPDGGLVPKHGPQLRKIASDAVKYVYNHGAGKKRTDYEGEREEKARRFRAKYGSVGKGADGEEQGNVQPKFIGVFDTVAALGSTWVRYLVLGVILILMTCLALGIQFDNTWLSAPSGILLLIVSYWFIVILKGQFKYFYDDPTKKPSFLNPFNWPSLIKNGHLASWSQKNYDRFLDNTVRFARHAVSINENRKSFPRVPWGSVEDMKRNADLRPEWFKQIWFAGNHSDIGGSYPEEESRLSDISLQWMLGELSEAISDIRVRDDLIVTSPDPLGLQHDEVISVKQKLKFFTWAKQDRKIGAPLHDSVKDRLDAEVVPIMGEMKKYKLPGSK